MSQLLIDSVSLVNRTRRALTRLGRGHRCEISPNVHETLTDDLVSKRMIPLVAEIKAGSIGSFGPMIAHPGGEVLYVRIGETEMHTDGYTPVRLQAGDGTNFDSAMRHACISRPEVYERVLRFPTPDRSWQWDVRNSNFRAAPVRPPKSWVSRSRRDWRRTDPKEHRMTRKETG